MAHWPTVTEPQWRRLGAGLINDTFAVRCAQGDLVLQRVSALFNPAIHHNIRAVTEHLAGRGMSTPRLMASGQGLDWVDLGERGVWRLMTRVPGATFDRADSSTQIHAAGDLLGRFHRALDDLDHAWVAGRVGVHDTARHLRDLDCAVADHGGHRLYDEVAPLAERVFALVERLPSPPDDPARPVHGDPKLNNILFSGPSPPASERARCLVDLDTVGPMPRWQELGDALRSWCNQAGEDDPRARFDPDLFDAAVAGYAQGAGGLDASARGFLVHALRWIALELCARFAADALRERYFGWDPERFPGRAEHNMVRARGQWALAEAVEAAHLLANRAVE